jgi:hypothetical protein
MMDPAKIERALMDVRELMAEAYREKKRMNGGELLQALMIANVALEIFPYGERR